MAAPTAEVLASLPDQSLFSLFPSNPTVLVAPPANTSSLSWPPPWSIPNDVYRAALDVRVPVTVACVYGITAKLLNSYNLSRGKRPWAISQTRPFFVFVVLHNVFLAIYSAWTFSGLLGALRSSIVSPSGPHGLAGTVDSLCRMMGPEGLGHDVFYSEAMGQWARRSLDGAVTTHQVPRTSTPGRLWNEGLAFYGWIFYLSKFYEVLDTFIILAKGKLSSTLQTYHHAGAMLGMWAGIRYMAPPIWMFVVFNSAIHAMMYSYYTLTALSIRVPIGVKRTLTTLQIMQFLVGATLSMVHSFISYTVPVTRTLTGPVDMASNPSMPTAASTWVMPRVLAGLKRLLPDVAANGSDGPVASPHSISGHAAAPAHVRTETAYMVQSCITTKGATFAIWINVLYLAPLTYLFIKFFITSYLRRSNAEIRVPGKVGSTSNVALAERAGWDAATGLGREVYGEGGQDGTLEANGTTMTTGKAI